MEKVAPLGPVYQAGTLSGNPLAMAAGIATLEELSSIGFYEDMETRAATFGERVNEILDAHGNPAYLSRVGSIFHLWFKANQSKGPSNYEDIKSADVDRFGRYFRAVLENGVWLAPSAFEVGFISAAHTQSLLDATATAMNNALETSS